MKHFCILAFFFCISLAHADVISGGVIAVADGEEMRAAWAAEQPDMTGD
jgi:hypothetical protein